ncbi:hypothetical protein A0H81_01856 [Grifola frondosa]|uniref:Uncharacterized protein n=1 Tax=Grifola frondosa TaxID=5627 RepID=A0A1C7MKG6_GRIFR|nr:hypothetical protein A0H81_01856 [Grifola frondosa]
MCLISDVEDMPLLMCFWYEGVTATASIHLQDAWKVCAHLVFSLTGDLVGLLDEIGLTSRVIFAEANREVGPISTGQYDVCVYWCLTMQSIILSSRSLIIECSD